MRNDAKRPAGAHGDGRLDVEMPLDEAVTGAVGGRLRRELQGADEITVSRPAKHQLATDAEYGCQRDALQQLPGMKVDLVGEAGVATGIRCRRTARARGRPARWQRR